MSQELRSCLTETIKNIGNEVLPNETMTKGGLKDLPRSKDSGVIRMLMAAIEIDVVHELIASASAPQWQHLQCPQVQAVQGVCHN